MSPFGKRSSFEVPCTVDIEQTADSFHAHVILDGDIEIRPGDEVTVHDAPTDIAFGERIVVRRMATVVRARLQGYLELTELYEVSFSNGRV